MNVARISANVDAYRKLLEEMQIPAKRLLLERTFASASREELLAHARYLTDHFAALDPFSQYGKLNRHLAAIQMCLSFAGVYTLGDLLEHNRPK